MSQLVFIHGPGAGSCAEAWHYQAKHFPQALAPTLPGHPLGRRCDDVQGYMEWLRGWLWAQGHSRDLVLVGYTLGACIALQYGLDYPDEVKGLVLMTIAAGPKQRVAGADALRLRAADDPQALEAWLAQTGQALKHVEPGLRARLLECHRRIGPLAQLEGRRAIDAFDARKRLPTLRPRLLLIRGEDGPAAYAENEKDIHKAVPGSRYVSLERAGIFPAVEQPAEINRLIEEFMTGL